MDHSPLVSVIIIFLNAGHFIEEAIQSVLSQSYSNWELLLVDGCSTDNSATIAQQYAKQFPRKIRYLVHGKDENSGMSASRNLGIRHSNGKLIAFLDADDIWLPNTLQEQVAVMETQKEATMVYGPLYWWYSWTNQPEDQGRDYIENLGVPSDTLIMPPTLLPLFLLNKAAVPSGILVRREAIDRVAGFEDDFWNEYEDQVFCAKICLEMPVFASSRSWYRYRQHPGSVVHIGLQTGQTKPARLIFLNWLARYLHEQGNKDAAVWRALWHELWRAKHPHLHRQWNRIKDLTSRVNQRWLREKAKLIGNKPS